MSNLFALANYIGESRELRTPCKYLNDNDLSSRARFGSITYSIEGKTQALLVRAIVALP